MDKLEVMRAEEEWQRAAAYSVRIQGMNRQYHIPLREEFDGHDCDGTKYIVILDDGYPIATCRFYPHDGTSAILGRVVVLPEYRGHGIGSIVVREAEQWIAECGFSRVLIDSRTAVVPFYEKLGYRILGGEVVRSGSFDCIRMEKQLR